MRGFSEPDLDEVDASGTVLAPAFFVRGDFTAADFAAAERAFNREFFAAHNR